jgi:hypothetical protein
MRWLLVLGLVALFVGVSTASSRAATYRSAAAGYSISYPQGWETVASSDGRIVVFVGPPYKVGGALFRPNLSVSVMPSAGSAGEQDLLAAVEKALSRAVPQVRRAGAESVRTADGKSAVVGYYVGRGVQEVLFVVGVALRGKNAISIIGVTSPAVPSYREHLEAYRHAVASLNVVGGGGR